MTALGVTLACLAAYALIGGLVARACLPSSWRFARKQWNFDDLAQDSVKAQTVCIGLFWPVLGLMRLIRCSISGSLESFIAEGDPRARERELRAREAAATEREQRIAQLERELGITS